MSEKKYLDATQELGKAFYIRGIKGPVVMLNLLKFKKEADYSNSPDLAPTKSISGKEAYELYIEHTRPFLTKVGGKILFQGIGGQFLIGPQNEYWDAVLLVKHKSMEVFMQFAQNTEYLKGIGHRTAALEDSRLLPIEENQVS